MKIINFKDLTFSDEVRKPSLDGLKKPCEEMKSIQDDKKKILSDTHDSMSFALNPFINPHRIIKTVDLDKDLKINSERFKKIYLGNWGIADKGDCVHGLNSMKIEVLKSRNTLLKKGDVITSAIGKNLFDRKDIHWGNFFTGGVTFAKEYKSEWIGRGEDMKKQTLFEKLGVERVWINEEKRSVTVELFNGNIGTAKADKNDEFYEQTGFANAYTIAKSGLSKTEFKKEFAKELDFLRVKELKEKKNKAIADLERKQRKEMQNLRKDLNSKK